VIGAYPTCIVQILTLRVIEVNRRRE
jgi:hypothetical protein